jgi:hypothetical protein
MATQKDSSPSELDKETLDAAGRCWEDISLSVRAVNQTHIGREIAKRELEAAA